MKYAVINIGCKTNQYESDCIAARLNKEGHEAHSGFTQADCYVINTCCVTSEAERKSRQAIARCLKKNPHAKVYVTGCAVENNKRQFEGKAGIFEVDRHSLNSPAPNRTRAFVKIQDGCNAFCSYCIIPRVRGRSVSRGIQSVVEECESIQHKTGEIVLTGINISDFQPSLAALLRALKGIKTRIRLSSVDMPILDGELLEACRGLQNFCPHFHLPLQSGDDGVLRDMNRKYTAAQFLAAVGKVREAFPTAGITTDIICGYPTETEQAFKNTLDTMSAAGFSDAHIFSFSARPKTVAANLTPLSGGIVKRRAALAAELARQLKTQWLQSWIGKRVEVLLESGNAGYTKEYIRVYAPASGTVVPKSLYKDGLMC